MVRRKFVGLFEKNNIIFLHFFRIPHRFGAKWNFVFMITFYTIKTKSTCKKVILNGQINI